MKGAKRSTKSKSTIELGGRIIPIQRVSGKAPIDASRFIPVVSTGARGAGQVRVIDRVDLLPSPTIAPAVAATVHFGDILVDVFSPIYGSYYPLGAPAFVINEARLRLILNSVWSMALAPGEQDDQILDFKIMNGIQANYLKVLIGHTLDASGNGAILMVGMNGTQFNLDLKAQSYQYFDLVLLGDQSAARDVRFTLSSAANNLRSAVCPIFQVELYDSIRIFPDPSVFAW